jgi:hypothetical protein
MPHLQLLYRSRLGSREIFFEKLRPKVQNQVYSKEKKQHVQLFFIFEKKDQEQLVNTLSSLPSAG